MRLIISYETPEPNAPPNRPLPLFIQGEWLDRAGLHARRLTEDMPAEIIAQVRAVLDWTIEHRDKTLAPAAELDEEIRGVEQELGRLNTRLSQLKAR